MGVIQLISIADHSPGVGVIAIDGGHRGPVGQIIFALHLHRGTGVRVGIDLVAQAVALGIGGVEIANRTIRIRQVARVGDDLQVYARDKILGDDLRYAAAIGARQGVADPRDIRVVGGAVVLANRVVRVRKSQRDRGQIAEHVLAQRNTRGVRDVVALHARGIRGRVSGLVVQVFDRAALLLAFILDLAGLAQDID